MLIQGELRSTFACYDNSIVEMIIKIDKRMVMSEKGALCLTDPELRRPESSSRKKRKSNFCSIETTIILQRETVSALLIRSAA